MKRFLFAFGLWTSILMLLAKGALKLTGINGDLAQMIRDYALDAVVINTCVMTALQGYPNMPEIKMPDGVKRAFALAILVGTAMLFSMPRAQAQTATTIPAIAIPATPVADFKLKSPKPILNAFSQPYDITRCGAYFGLNTMATATGVNGTGVSPGTQVVQAGIGGTLGYGCPINASNNSFWFAEVMGDLTNINGATTGISFNNAPASFTERFAVGTPIQTLLPSLSNFTGVTSTAALPSLPTLPAGITSGPAFPYLFMALHEQDVSAQLGLLQNREWLFSWGAGTGLLYRLSNGVVADVSAEYKLQTNEICVGPFGQSGCAKIGQGFMTQISFKY